MDIESLRTLILRSSLKIDDSALDLGETIKPAALAATLILEPDPKQADVPTEVVLSTATTVIGADGGVARESSESPREGKALRRGFELVDVLGQGGMGIVYRGKQLDLGREVAIKRVAASGPHRLSLRRNLLSEAVATGGLEHPNIVPVHTMMEEAGGELFLVMKLVGGQTLADRLAADRERASIAHLVRYVEILLAVSNAIAFAHSSRSIIHRDLKPENIMIGEFGEVLVMDWGIAVRCDEPAEDGAGIAEVVPYKSSQTEIVGTPVYMAPEMAEGRGNDLGPWTDTYQLGAILYEILVGEAPHRGGSLLDVLAHAGRSEPPELPGTAPEELRRICRKAMAREIPDRYQTARELQHDLRDFLEHRESRALSRHAAAELEAWCGRLKSEPITPENRARRYTEISDVISAFAQARFLWPGNEAARQAEARARLLYSEAALQAGDLGLAQWAIGESESEAATSLRDRVDAALAARRRTARATRWLGIALVLFQAAILLGLGFFADRRLETFQHYEIRDQLRRLTPAVAEALDQGRATDATQLDRIADTLAHDKVLRVTLIAPDGAVLADSEEDVATMASHRDRPEFVAAVAYGEGHDDRRSETLDEDMIYWAEAMRDDDGSVRAVVRTALPLSVVHDSINGLLAAGAFGLALSFLLTCLVILVASRRLSHSVARMV